MDVNKVTIVPDGTDKQINIPVRLTWDYLGLDMAIDEYESQIITEVVGVGRDFEVSRFAHAPATGTTDNTEINYEFYFYSGGSLDNISSWNNDYMSEGFTPQDLYYFNNNFANSFFKLDFYDTPDEKRQINYLTVIIPTQQGLTMNTQMSRNVVSVKKPKFILDYVGDKEGFFLYWLKKRTFLDIDTFYMTAKFFNAKKGQFIRMINVPQSTFVGPNVFNVNKQLNFYYKYILNYDTYEYAAYTETANGTLNRRGTVFNPIRWYEYVNP